MRSHFVPGRLAAILKEHHCPARLLGLLVCSNGCAVRDHTWHQVTRLQAPRSDCLLGLLDLFTCIAGCAVCDQVWLQALHLPSVIRTGFKPCNSLSTRRSKAVPAIQHLPGAQITTVQMTTSGWNTCSCISTESCKALSAVKPQWVH